MVGFLGMCQRFLGMPHRLLRMLHGFFGVGIVTALNGFF